MWKRKQCGDWNVKARVVEIEMWRHQSKEKEDEGRKDVFTSGWKMLLRIEGESDQGGDLFEVEWNHVIAEDWREDIKI